MGATWAELDDAIDRNLEKSLAELGELCAQPSIAGQGIGMRPCAELVAEMLSRRGFDAELRESDGFPVVFGQRPGQSDRTLLFYNHYDVQPPEPIELWETPPFEPSRRGGKLYARGVSDDKGHIACRLAAIDAFLDASGEVPCRIKFVIEGEEEIGSPNLTPFVEAHQKVLAADACIWEFGGVDHEGTPILYAGLRGILYVELRCRTAREDAHSGLGGSIFPNSAWRLTWALASLKDEQENILIPGFHEAVLPATDHDLELLRSLPESGPDLLERYGLRGFLKGLSGGLELKRQAIFEPTCTICGLESGYTGQGPKTVLPAQAMAKVDFRLVPDQSPAEILGKLREHLSRAGFDDIEVRPLGAEPPGRTDPNHPFLRLVAETAASVYGRPQLITPMSGGSGPIHPFVDILGLPVATIGVSYPGANVHAPNENLVIENFVNGVRHTARVIDRFSQGQT